MQPYLCPNCKTNRSRFNLLQQEAKAVKMNPRTGERDQEYNSENMDPFHMSYQGPEMKVQCGACGLVEDEKSFIAYAEHNQLD
ncbi:hypothetical protein SAMN05192559_101790 [Halobacillus karajensis]|uniref:Uncharacterized protein n=1 Tax=Halobacillus karajensis TaxID=195088 RepID=A0A059NX50_9BACI|nr:hypothetical protein [Halobacillus karajensis]CDQ18598.1 hypothetical protein BN982_00872 [Halobacillus karajensis]CDQ23330.1 hypothetical protein BN983_01556 [Halobacillus karajensis]CDQ26812.1 hypothetical protein BN981_01036 [Halobacillus karajensis]SEH49378.1 hypothetical protein SAMN05192559_101790 [Halobacillus karajensis]